MSASALNRAARPAPPDQFTAARTPSGRGGASAGVMRGNPSIRYRAAETSSGVIIGVLGNHSKPDLDHVPE